MTLHERQRRHVAWGLISVFLSVLLLGACTTVPQAMRVRSGVDPRYQDDKVRFRTTYYFRVFDVCRDLNGNMAKGLPQHDSLYRFRMTGKSSSVFTQVRFESGILHKTEIDPFGASVVFDDKLGRHRFVSREETDAAARRNERYDEIQRRMDLLEDLKNRNDTQKDEPFAGLIKEVIKGIKKQIANLDAPAVDTPSKEVQTQDNSRSTNSVCPADTELRRGFQIIGPEGVATFNQDQRLIMAMASNGKPLIGVLKELSGRMLAEHGSGSDRLLPLVQENLAALRAERVVDRLENDPNVSIALLIERVIEAFNQDKP